MNKNNKIWHIKTFALFVLIFCFNQISFGQSELFEPLIQSAWKTNQQLKSKDFQLQKSMFEWKESKAMFGPDIKFGTQYTLAAGGRDISFPIGDLLNPVYSTLNLLTQSNRFPQVDNVNEQLLPNNFYDARFRITQPIYYPDLAIQKKLKSGMIDIKSLEIKAFKRHITKETMQAAIQAITAKYAINIFLNAKKIAEEAERTTGSMIKNGIALPSALIRIENQKAELDAKLIESSTNFKMALERLNFVTGNNISESLLPINLPENILFESDNEAKTLENIKQLNNLIALQNLAIDREDAFYKPRIGAQLDIGSQAFDFGFKPYALLGVTAEINIFDSKRHNLRKNVVQQQMMADQANLDHTQNQIDLSIKILKNQLKSAQEQYNTYQSRLEGTKKLYDETLKKYKSGTINYLELLDAQVQIQQIETQMLIAKNTIWTHWSELVYFTAAYPIE